MSSIELKPCPHCGSGASFRIVSHQLLGGEHPLAGMEYIDCNNKLCGASTVAMYSTGEDCKPLLAERWNRRFDAAIKAEQTCVCGEPMSLGIVHRKDGPCYIPYKHPEQPSAISDERIMEIYLINGASPLQFARALLSERPGWVSVPREPTIEMWDAAWNSIGLPYRAILSMHDIKTLFDKFHAAMLSAAPKETK